MLDNIPMIYYNMHIFNGSQQKSSTKGIKIMLTLAVLREVHNQPSANVFNIGEDKVKVYVDMTFGENKLSFGDNDSFYLVLDESRNNLIINQIMVNDEGVFFSMCGDLTVSDEDNEFAYVTYKKDGKTFVFTNDKQIISTCKNFHKFNLTSQ